MWPMQHYLITTGNLKKDSNIVTVSFCMPVSKNPPLIACALGKNFYSTKLIKENKEFIINVVEEKFKKQIYFCGFNSGYKVDKFKETNLTPKKSKSVSVPIIDEAIAHMECKLEKIIETGDKYLFIGKVVEAYAKKEVIENKEEINYAKGDFPRSIYSIRNDIKLI
jgi:flavin reductase (DIM6/NTAB) family NADH-FMN oxidoreductase RutF